MNNNVGYHAGDLGKADSLGSQYGSKRGTGHFGTGTYFVGNQENIAFGGYKERPQVVVDFSGYNLYRLYNEREGRNLHDGLKAMNHPCECI